MKSALISQSTLRQWLKYVKQVEANQRLKIAILVSSSGNHTQLDSSDGQFIARLDAAQIVDETAERTNDVHPQLGWLSSRYTQLSNGYRIAVIATSASEMSDDKIAVLTKLTSACEISLATEQHSGPEIDLIDFINSLDDHVWIKNLAGSYTHCNNSVEQAWGLTPAQIVGKKDHQIFDSTLTETFVRMDKKVIEHDKQLVVDECYRSENGNDPNWLETIKAPVKDSSGNLLGILGMTRNVTDRKFALDKLDLARSLLNKTKEALVITDSDNNIIDVNAAFSEITGYTVDEVMGRNPRLLASGRHNEDFYRKMWKSIHSTGTWQGEFINRRKDGSLYHQQTTINVLYSKDSTPMPNYLCVFEDVSQRKEDEKRMRHLVEVDSVTSLPNRNKLIDQVEQCIAGFEQNGSSFTLIQLDLDNFKRVNDSVGHAGGDLVLQEVARRIQRAAPSNGFTARVSGDEFMLLLPDICERSEIIKVIEAIQRSLLAPVDVIGHEPIRLTSSFGVAIYPKDGISPAELMRNADSAKFVAKQNGRNDFAFYDPEILRGSASHLRIQSALVEAIESEQFRLVYQPQYNMDRNTLTGFEALLRWDHPKYGAISPSEFIPVAESSGLIVPIGLWVLEEAVKQAKAWLKKGFKFGRIAVNVAGRQMLQDDFVDNVSRVLKKHDLSGHYIEVEVTESFTTSNTDKVIEDLNALHELGIQISLDDFGTGYSSMAYLKKLPIDKLKIDRSFVMDTPHDSDSNAIANAIILMAHALGMKVLAEGIEHMEQAEYLTSKGCVLGQGYVFAKPLPVEEAEKLLAVPELV